MKGKSKKAKGNNAERCFTGAPRNMLRAFVRAHRVIACILIFAFFLFPFPFSFASAQNRETKSELAANGFPRFVDEYLSDFYARHPSLAAASGIHTWDSQLEDYSSSAISSEIATIKKFQLRLEKIPPLELGFSDLFDHQIIASNMKARLLELEQIRSHEHNPKLYSDTISNNLLQLAMFDYAPADARLAQVIAKEKLIPRLLDSAHSNEHGVPAALLKVGIEGFKGTLSFVQADLPKAFASVLDTKLQGEFKKSTKIASDAISKHLGHLIMLKADPLAPFAIGRTNYEAKLKFEEGIDVPVDVLLKIAYRELLNTQEEFYKTAARIDPHRSSSVVWDEVQRNHPKPGQLVADARGQLEALARFIGEKRILTQPELEGPLVAPTPDFMRWSTASMWTPGPFENLRVKARYLITDVDPKWSEKQKEEYLASINYPQLWATSVHEAYPGHFIQACALRHVQSPVRRSWALAPGSFVEGWAHYTEQMMLEEGFGSGDPKMKLGQLAEALLRLCRFVVGIRMHCEGLNVDQGTKFFMANAFMAETPSRIEAERGTFDPTYLVYSVGKLAILKLREDYKRYRGEDFSLSEFHDLLLSNGNAPIWVHRQMLMPGDRGKLIE